MQGSSYTEEIRYQVERMLLEQEGISYRSFNLMLTKKMVLFDNWMQMTLEQEGKYKWKEKGRKCQADLLLEKKKRNMNMSRMQRKGKLRPMMIFYTQLAIRLLLEKNRISILLCFKLVTMHHEEYYKLLDAENQWLKGNWFDDLN